MRILYDFFFFLFSIFYLPFFFIKGKHRGGFLQRLGVVPQNVRTRLAGKKIIWVHAVSVGEMSQGVRFAHELKKRVDGVTIVLTATTAAGRELAEKLKSPDDTALYFPVDFRSCIRAFIRTVNPCALVILETEIWPNLIFELSAKKIPIFIVNARVSDKAIKSYRRVKFLLKPLLNRLTQAAAQDHGMRGRFVELGMDARRVTATGNMKFDWTPPLGGHDVVEKIQWHFLKHGDFLLVAGSTHEGEEEILFELFKSIRAKNPAFKLLIAPRHLNRLEAIRAQAAAMHIAQSDGFFLLDEMGVLANCYRLADLVFIGGSLVPVGGHNLVEPAYFEKPILFGPFMQNFKEMADIFKRENAAIEVPDREALETAVLSLFSDASRRRTLGAAAKKLLGAHQGATERNIQIIVKELSK